MKEKHSRKCVNLKNSKQTEKNIKKIHKGPSSLRTWHPLNCTRGWQMFEILPTSETLPACLESNKSKRTNKQKTKRRILRAERWLCFHRTVSSHFERDQPHRRMRGESWIQKWKKQDWCVHGAEVQDWARLRPWAGTLGWDSGLGPWAEIMGWDPGLEPWARTLGWDPGLEPWAETLGWDPGLEPWAWAHVTHCELRIQGAKPAHTTRICSTRMWACLAILGNLSFHFLFFGMKSSSFLSPYFSLELMALNTKASEVHRKRRILFWNTSSPPCLSIYFDRM